MAMAQNLLKRLCKFETAFFLKVWFFDSLVSYLEGLQSQFLSYFEETESWFAKHVLSDTSPDEILQNMTKKRSDAKATKNADYQNRVFSRVIDCSLSEVKSRSKVYADLYSHFNFLANLAGMSSEDIKEACIKVAEIYKNDVCGLELFNECEIAKYYFSNDAEIEVTHSYYNVFKFGNPAAHLSLFLCD